MLNVKAREFYYSEIAPEESNATYQELHLTRQHESGSKLRLQLGDERVDEYLDRVRRWTPQYSNDFLLDELMKEFISIHVGAVSEYLQSIFVGKRMDKFANANAHWKCEASDVNIVLFNVGLSDVAYQYSILFDHFSMLPTKLLAKDYDARTRFNMLVMRLLDSHKRWDQEGNVIQLTLEDMLDHEHVDPEGKSAEIAVLTDRFILCHEIAHHMLGHTIYDERNVGSFHSATVFAPEKWEDIGVLQRDEMEADIRAIGIMLGTPGQTAKDTQISTVLGTLLTMTLFGQLEKDVNVPRGDHPSMKMRYLNVLECLDDIGLEYFDSIFRDITNFQRVLYREQGRGLGSCCQEIEEFLENIKRRKNGRESEN